MPKTIAELERVLVGRGYECKRVSETLVVDAKTIAYQNAFGEHSAQLLYAFGPECLTVTIPVAFESISNDCKDLLHEILFVAASRTPTFTTHVNPCDGGERLRLDIPYHGDDGVREIDAVRAITLLLSVVDEWFCAIHRATSDDSLTASSRTRKKSKTTNAEKLGSIAHRGGGINRLRVLLQFRRRLDLDGCDSQDGATNGNDAI